MAKTTTQRVNEWRKRMALRASYFDWLNEDRVRRLGFDPADNRPEYAAIRRYMVNYPRAKTAPVAVGYSAEEGGWFVDFEAPANEDDLAVAALAIRSVTSAPAFIRVTGDGSGGLVSVDEVRKIAVASEIEEMKRLGMWAA